MATRLDLIVEQGTTFSTNVEIKHSNGSLMNLSSFSANAVFRKHYTSNSFVQFTTSIDTNTSVITLSLAANSTDGVEAGRYVYDLLIDDGSSINRVREGFVNLTPQVT